jgi:hypothetical protein
MLLTDLWLTAPGKLMRETAPVAGDDSVALQ